MTEIRRLVLALAAFAALAFAALSATSVPAQSEEIGLDAILARKLLCVGVTGGYRPTCLLDRATTASKGAEIDFPHRTQACSQ